MFQKLVLKLQSLQIPYRYCTVGTVLAVLSCVPILTRRKPSTFSEVLILLAGFAFAVGFALWVVPKLRKAWASSFGKLALTLLHGLVLLLSVILARFLVAEALGLPPQDFDMTVSILTLLLYLPVWILVIAGLTFLFFATALVCVAVLFIADHIVSLAILPLQLLLPTESREHLSSRRRVLGYKGLCLVMGVAAVSLMAAHTWDWSFAEIRSLGPLIRLVAYYSDFQEVSLYPGVEVNKRLRLHENGVVSYAERQGWVISISVKKIQ